MEQTISERLQELLDRHLRQHGLVATRLCNPLPLVVRVLERVGVQFGAKGFDVWCNSSSCGHTSHDEGQAWQTVYLPQAWLDEAQKATPEIWDYPATEEYRPVAIIPMQQPLLLAERALSESFAATTLAFELQPVLKALLQEEAAQYPRGHTLQE